MMRKGEDWEESMDVIKEKLKRKEKKNGEKKNKEMKGK